MKQTLIEKVANLWDIARHGQSDPCTAIHIPHKNISPPLLFDHGFAPSQHYFQVRLNQAYLAYSREWFVEYDPVVLVITEFLYGREFVTVPFLVGPSLFEGQGVKIPTGVSIRDTRVAGLHPYRGERISIKLILYKLKRDNAARKLIDIMEGLVTAFDISTTLAVYLQLTDVVLGGLESLLGLGDIEPILAYSREFDPNAGDYLGDGYYALMLKSQVPKNIEEALIVKDNALFHKTSDLNISPYAASDYILFSLRGANERTDTDRLPFHSTWLQALNQALIPFDGHWVIAKSHLASLYQSMVNSDDLSMPQIDKLRAYYISEILRQRRQAIELSNLSSEPINDEATNLMNNTLNILDL